MSISAATYLVLALFLPTDMDRTAEPTGMDMETPVVSVSDEASQKWMSSFSKAKELSAKTNLPMLLHFEATWCGACRQMESDVLQKQEVKLLLGKGLIGVKIDADQNKDLIREFGIQTLPTEVLVQPDGTRGSKMTGAVSLSSYVSRLRRIGTEAQARIAGNGEAAEPENSNVRSCLIVRRDGKMVGLGGFSPVSLVTNRKWLKGDEQFVAVHEGVEYFLTSEKELAQFNAEPQNYIPKLHGCDLVELYLQNKATTGAIEYGSFYEGKVFFFASLQNRDRFENNPTWYLRVMTDSRTVNDEMFPFLQDASVEN